MQATRILKPDQQEVLVQGKEIMIRLPDPMSTATNVEVFVNVTFNEPGTYWVEVCCDATLKLRYPLRVGIVQQQQSPPPAQG